jgi:hypothetical protein
MLSYLCKDLLKQFLYNMDTSRRHGDNLATVRSNRYMNPGIKHNHPDFQYIPKQSLMGSTEKKKYNTKGYIED